MLASATQADKVHNILFAGVGGQGVLLAAELTALAALRMGFDVKQTEVHGVSQRGGSVECHVRFGPRVWSPMVTPGEADLVVGLEKLEALRFAHFVQRSYGTILVNDHAIIPGSVAGAQETYPFHAIEFLQQKSYRVMAMPASRVARDLGDGRMVNTVMLGAASALIPIPEETWLSVLESRLPARFRDANLKAFAAGRVLAAGSA